MNRFWLTFLLLGCVTICSSKEYKDTLWTTDNDRIILTYDLRYNSDGVDIRFLDVKKKLGRINAKRYKKLEDVEVIFFDRTGVYEDMTFTNITPEAFMVPSNLKYSKSDIGYFSLLDRPSLSFQIKGKEKETISIPLYLAYYEGKGERKLFSVCKKFNITLKGNNSSKASMDKEVIQESITSTIELDADNELSTDVLEQIKTVYTSLEAQSRHPFSEMLNYEIMHLRDLDKKVKDRQLSVKIKECLTSCELKRQELEDRALAETKNAQAEMERLAKLEQEREQARQDSIAVAQQKQAEAEKKRNIWMIIGGVILAALCFIGNQVFQHFRNIRNQRSMMEMQQDIARRAENEAKRHAQNYVRRKTNEVVNNARRSTQELVRNKVKQSGGNKPKNISI